MTDPVLVILNNDTPLLSPGKLSRPWLLGADSDAILLPAQTDNTGAKPRPAYPQFQDEKASTRVRQASLHTAAVYMQYSIITSPPGSRPTFATLDTLLATTESRPSPGHQGTCSNNTGTLGTLATSIPRHHVIQEEKMKSFHGDPTIIFSQGANCNLCI